MTELIELETKRLRLRQWRPADHEAFTALNADPRVMEFFPSPFTRVSRDIYAACHAYSERTEGMVSPGDHHAD